MAAAACLLLPASTEFDVAAFDASLRQALGRADRLHGGGPGRRAQLRRHLHVTPHVAWPLAALARQQECADAGDDCWLRADPVHVRPDMNGARLLGWGESLQLTAEETAALQESLQPLFDGAGFALDVSLPWHWYLRLPSDTPVPAFIDPAEALGTDVGEALDVSKEARRWRVLESEAQIILHNHPVNHARRARGLMTANAVWFWGCGVLPRSVEVDQGWTIASHDPSVHILARAAQAWGLPPDQWMTPQRDTVIDLVRIVRPAEIASDWMSPALADLQSGKLRSLLLDFADGLQWRLERQQRWRLFRKPIASLH